MKRTLAFFPFIIGVFSLILLLFFLVKIGFSFGIDTHYTSETYEQISEKIYKIIK